MERTCSRLTIEEEYEGEFYAGLDPAQTRDFHVLSVIERVDQKLLLRHLKIFPHPTFDAYVLGYIKALQDRWGGFSKIRVDITREGPSFIADMENAGIDNAEGVIFSSVPEKAKWQAFSRSACRINGSSIPC